MLKRNAAVIELIAPNNKETLAQIETHLRISLCIASIDLRVQTWDKSRENGRNNYRCNRNGLK